MKQLLIAALVALPMAAFAGPSKKDKDEAQAHVAKATEAHQAGNFEVAKTELEAAYALDPQSDLLFALGQVHTKLNNCPVAIDYYQKFLDTKPAADAASAANEAIKSCQDTLAAQPPPQPTPPPEPTPPKQEMPPPPPPSSGHKFDIIGTSLVGVGVVSAVVGVAMYASAVSTLDDAEKAPTYQKHLSDVDDAHSKRNLAIIFTAVGVAAIGVGGWHYLHFKSKDESSHVAVIPTTTGGTVSWMGRF